MYKRQGPLRLYPDQAKVYRQEEELFRTAMEYRLLLAFMRHPGQVLPRSRLMEALWDVAGAFVEANTLSVYVRRLREKIGEMCIRDSSAKSKCKMSVGVDVLPSFTKDTTDRNRTSPFAFTGNKFEFRMLGSSLNIACPNYILNTIVAEALRQFADQLEQSEDFESALHNLIVQNYTAHKLSLIHIYSSSFLPANFST